MPLSPPASPTVSQLYTANGRTWAWTGAAWELVAASGVADSRWNLFLPAAPTSVTASAGNGQASVSWTAPAGVISQAPVTDYVVQFSSNSGSTWTNFSDGTSTTASAVVTSLTNGTAYTFRVAAVNGIGQGAYSTASAEVTPASGPFEGISGMFGWWDASDTTTMYSDTAGTTLATSGDVLRWNDKSGSNNHAIIPSELLGVSKPQLTASARNSLPALQFSNSNAGFSVGDKLPLTSTGATVFAAVRVDTSGFGYPTLLSKNQTGNYYGWGITPDTVFWRSSIYAQTAWSATNQAWVVMAVTIPAGNWPSTTVHLNGVAASQAAYNEGLSSPPSTSTNLMIGRHNASGEVWRSFIGELVVFEGTLNTSQRGSITTYLMNKWGIS
jgi:hypothetical protein